MSGPLLLLGPQRPRPNMPAALSACPGRGPILYVTAGWRHDESEDEALRHDIGTGGHVLPLYQWFEDLAVSAPGLFAAHHQQQGEIRKLKALYQLRLEPALQAVRLLLSHQEQQPDSEPIREELEEALAALRSLRARFVSHCDAARQKFVARHRPLEHKAVRGRIEELRSALSQARAVLIAGGHVGVLRNRLEFFGLGDLLAEQMSRGMGVIGWSAGAMVLTETVALFHDDPPTGKSDPEVLDRGMGFAPGIVVLPHARQRLWLHDRARVSLLALRFAPAICVGLENGAWLERREDRWINRGSPDSAFILQPDGQIALLEVADA